MKTLIFDFDGVFVDSFQVSLEAIQNLHLKYELPDVTEEDFKNMFCGNLWEEHAKYGLSKEKEEAFKKELLQKVEGEQDRVEFFPNIAETISLIAERGYNLIILTSNKSSSVQEKLATLGLAELFVDIQGADQPGNKEEKLSKILQDNNESEQIFFITDTVGDIREAKKAHVKTIGVTWGFHTREYLEETDSEYVVNNPKELLTIL